MAVPAHDSQINQTFRCLNTGHFCGKLVLLPQNVIKSGFIQESINFIMFSSLSNRKSPFGSTERKIPVKKLAPEFSKVKTKTPKHSPVKEEPCGSLSETVCKRELRSQETPEKPRSSVDTPPRLSTPQKGPSTHPKEKAFSSEIEDLPYLSTTEMYLCRWHQPPPSPLPLRESSPKKEETVASKA